MAALEKNQLYTVEIEDYTSEGLGVCRAGNPGGRGQAVFVRGGVRGDTCAIRILKAARGAVWAKVEEIITPSPHRAEPDCAAFPACGGCDFRHISYQEELYFKRNHTRQTLARIGGADIGAEEVVPAPSRNGWRNKAIFQIAPVRGRAATGFYRSGSNLFVPSQDCPAAMPPLNACAAAVREWIDREGIGIYDPETRKGLARRLFVRATGSGVQAMPVLNGTLARRQAESLVSVLRESCPGITGVLTVENKRTDNVMIGGGPVNVLWGGETLTETLPPFEFEFHPLAFMQVNSGQAVKLYDRAAAYAAPGPEETALDLYCGAGTLTLRLAAQYKAAAGVEIEERAVECARRNAVRNGVNNAEFIRDAVSEESCLGPRRNLGVVTVDPPRAGLSEQDALMIAEKLSPARIVYVSCNPGTLARDVKRLMEHGYAAPRLTLVDMFPGTRHIESVLLLNKI